MRRLVSYKPMRHEWGVLEGKEHDKMFWHEDEIQLRDDIAQFREMEEGLKRLITQILRVFTQSDQEVAGNYIQMLGLVENNEIRHMLLSFAAREVVHQRSYALLTETLGLGDAEFEKWLEVKEMKEKLEIMSNLEDLESLVGSSAVFEGVSLFSAFVLLLNFQRFGLMLGTAKIVEFSVKDENFHCSGMAKLYKNLGFSNAGKLKELMKEAVEKEDALLDYLYVGQEEILGLKKSDLKQYMRYLADFRLKNLGIDALYDVQEVPEGMNWIKWMLEQKSHTNFFESRVSDYAIGGLEGEYEY